MPHPFVFSVEIIRVSPVYPMHDLQEISFGGLEDEMVVHQDLGMDQHIIAIMVISQKAKELCPVPSVQEDFSPLISRTGDVIQRPRIFNSNRSSHGSWIPYLQHCGKFQTLAPILTHSPLFVF